MGVLTLFDAHTGVPTAVIDATDITAMRTGAVTAIGAQHLARPDAKILGHIGARGTSYWNVRLLDRLFDFDEIRVHSRRPESREAFAATLRRDLGKGIVVTGDWESAVRGANIVVEASRCRNRRPCCATLTQGSPSSAAPPHPTPRPRRGVAARGLAQAAKAVPSASGETHPSRCRDEHVKTAVLPDTRL